MNCFWVALFVVIGALLYAPFFLSGTKSREEETEK